MEGKSFNNSLLLCSTKISLYNSLLGILKEISINARGFEVDKKIKKEELNLNRLMKRFPYSIRDHWDNHFLNKINRKIINEIQSYDPDIVLVYNSEFLLPDTCAFIKKRSRLIFYMGDSPFYTPLNNYYLTCLTYADLILSPDSFWLDQLNTLGLTKTAFFIPTMDLDSYYVIPEEQRMHEIKETEILYMGTSYSNSWGYKKALLMNQFRSYDFQLYGNSMWRRWFRFFPDLEAKFIESGYIPTPRLNQMFNKTKIIPVDGNPAILNGFHLRLFEAIGAGALPLVEYRRDIIELVFKGRDAIIPLIRDYTKASDLAAYFLLNENERTELVQSLKAFIIDKYSFKANAFRLLELLNKNIVDLYLK